MSSKMRALTEIARIVLAIAMGYLIYWQWSELRGNIDPEYYAIGAGVIVTLMMIILLKKLNKGEGS
ncbi:MAG: hypothetical protein WC492_00715 [Candidatus Micrarchaeia archaeon]